MSIENYDALKNIQLTLCFLHRNTWTKILIGSFILTLTFWKCNSKTHITTTCLERDLVCRSKNYMNLIKEHKFEELHQHAKLDVVNNARKDAILFRLSDFLNNNDSLHFSYTRIGNDNSEIINVEVRVRNDSFKNVVPVIVFLFAKKSNFGIPLLNWVIAIPSRKCDDTLFKLLEEPDSSKIGERDTLSKRK